MTGSCHGLCSSLQGGSQPGVAPARWCAPAGVFPSTGVLPLVCSRCCLPLVSPAGVSRWCSRQTARLSSRRGMVCGLPSSPGAKFSVLDAGSRPWRQTEPPWCVQFVRLDTDGCNPVSINAVPNVFHFSMERTSLTMKDDVL